MPSELKANYLESELYLKDLPQKWNEIVVENKNLWQELNLCKEMLFEAVGERDCDGEYRAETFADGPEQIWLCASCNKDLSDGELCNNEKCWRGKVRKLLLMDFKARQEAREKEGFVKGVECSDCGKGVTAEEVKQVSREGGFFDKEDVLCEPCDTRNGV